MTLFCVLAALLWEHLRPLRAPWPPGRVLERYLAWLLEHVNAGEEKHGLLAWTAGAFAPALVAGLLGAFLGEVSRLLEWAWSVLVLYFCMGFKHYSFQAASVARALRSGDLQRARETLMEWRPGAAQAMDANELARAGIEQVLRLALNRMFGVLFWFALLGVFGAVLYRLSGLCRERWHAEQAFCAFPARLVALLDWLPARALAFSFAIVGNFEDAMTCWRGQSQTWGESNEGVLLAAGAGALGVRLGGPLTLPGGPLLRPELGCGEAADPDYLEGVVSLIWRAVMLWVGVMGLLWLGSL